MLAVLLVGAALRYVVYRSAQKVSAPSRTEVRTWYPEPQVLLDWQGELNLTGRQLRQIEVADRQWQIQKAAYDAQLHSFGSSAAQALGELAAGKERSGRYGQLLHDFDLARDAAWKSATIYLNTDQVLKLDEIRKNPVKRKK